MCVYCMHHLGWWLGGVVTGQSVARLVQPVPRKIKYYGIGFGLLSSCATSASLVCYRT